MDIFLFEDLRGVGVVSLLIKSLLSIICGGIIGIERGVNRQAAGFRTHIVVCMGACITMVTGQYVFLYISPSVDPTRLGAQVISGIGFLGAGTIISSNMNHRVRGLTTAAGLWADACIGLAIGIGYYEAAIVGTLVIFVAITVFKRVDRMFYARSQMMMLYLELDGMTNLQTLQDTIRDNGIIISSIEVSKPKSGIKSNVGVSLVIHKKNRKDKVNMLDVVMNTPGLVYIENAN